MLKKIQNVTCVKNSLGGSNQFCKGRLLNYIRLQNMFHPCKDFTSKDNKSSSCYIWYIYRNKLLFDYMQFSTYGTSVSTIDVSKYKRVTKSKSIPSDMCAQQRFRSDCAFAQSDLNLCWAHWIAKDAVSTCRQ